MVGLPSHPGSVVTVVPVTVGRALVVVEVLRGSPPDLLICGLGAAGNTETPWDDAVSEAAE